jgi:hypothetical protein
MHRLLALLLVVACVPPPATTTRTSGPTRVRDAAGTEVASPRLSTAATLIGLVRDDDGWWLTYDMPSDGGPPSRKRTRIDASGIWAPESSPAPARALARPVADPQGRWYSLASGSPAWSLVRDDGAVAIDLGARLDEGSAATIAIDPGSSTPRGAIVWWHVDELAEHDNFGNGESGWRVSRREGEPRLVSFVGDRVRHQSLGAAIDELEHEVGTVAIGVADAGYVATWRGRGRVLHAAWIAAEGDIVRRSVTPALPDIGDPSHLVVAPDGSTHSFAISTRGGAATIDAVGFAADGQPRPVLRMREPHADGSRAAAIRCGGRPWLLYVRDAGRGEVEVRATSIDRDRLAPPVTLRTIAIRGRDEGTALSSLELDLRVGCRGDEGAYAALVRVDERLEQALVVFGTWAAGSDAT